MTPRKIDITPTWGEIGNIARRFALSNEVNAFKHLEPDIAKAFAMAEAMNQIMKSLSDEQIETVSRILVAELAKQGF